MTPPSFCPIMLVALAVSAKVAMTLTLPSDNVREDDADGGSATLGGDAKDGDDAVGDATNLLENLDMSVRALFVQVYFANIVALYAFLYYHSMLTDRTHPASSHFVVYSLIMIKQGDEVDYGNDGSDAASGDYDDDDGDDEDGIYASSCVIS